MRGPIDAAQIQGCWLRSAVLERDAVIAQWTRSMIQVILFATLFCSVVFAQQVGMWLIRMTRL